MLPRLLKGIWFVLALTPFSAYRNGGIGLNQSGLSTLITLFFYGLGWLLLRAALKRDPKGEVLEVAWRSAAVRVAGVGALLLLQVMALTMPGDVLLVALLSLATFLFGLWAWSRSGEVFAERIEKILVMSISLGLMILMGEYLLRLPGVVARTGGDTPGMGQWAAKNYDALSRESNLLRLRSFHTDRPKPPGTFRIVTLGDSYTWGSKIGRTQDLWPYVMERALHREDRPVQVINLGRPGFTTVNEAEMLDCLGWLFEPDLVILEFTLNDIVPSGPNFSHEAENWYFRIVPLLPVVHQTLDDRSYLYSFLNSRFRSLQMQRRYPDGYAPLFKDDFKGWQACQEAIRNIAQQTKQRNVPILGVIFPMFVPGNKLDEKTYPYTAVHRKVRDAMKEGGLPVLDLRPVYERFNRDGRAWWAMPCDAHPSIEGHKVAGEAIAKKVVELGVIAARSVR